MGLSDEEEDHKDIINDYEDFVSELDLDADLPKLPDLLEVSRYNNKISLQNSSIRNIRAINSNEGKIVELIRALKLKVSAPLTPQL